MMSPTYLPKTMKTCNQSKEVTFANSSIIAQKDFQDLGITEGLINFPCYLSFDISDSQMRFVKKKKRFRERKNYGLSTKRLN